VVDLVRLQVPDLSEIGHLPVDVVQLVEPGVVAVTAWANDGDAVTVTWDDVAASIHVRWVVGEQDRALIERETSTTVSIRGERGVVEFRIWSEMSGFSGELVVRVGEHVTITDALLHR
jgi:hypothetical protein